MKKRQSKYDKDFYFHRLVDGEPIRTENIEHIRWEEQNEFHLESLQDIRRVFSFRVKGTGNCLPLCRVKERWVTSWVIQPLTVLTHVTLSFPLPTSPPEVPPTQAVKWAEPAPQFSSPLNRPHRNSKCKYYLFVKLTLLQPNKNEGSVQRVF